MDKPETFRFTLRGLLVLTTAIALVFALGRWLDDYGGLVIAIPITVVPLCFVVERVFSRSRIFYAPATPGLLIRRHLAVVAGALTTAMVAWVSILDGVPTLTAPMPFLVVVPLLFGLPMMVVMAIPLATFLILNLYLGRAAMPQAIPLRFPVLLAMATVLSICWFAYAAEYSYGYHGPTYTIGITMINVSAILLLWAAWFFLRRRASFWPMLLWSLALTCWLFWFAFPWLGEMI